MLKVVELGAREKRSIQQLEVWKPARTPRLQYGVGSSRSTDHPQKFIRDETCLRVVSTKVLSRIVESAGREA